MVPAIFLVQLILRASFSQNISGEAEKEFEATSSTPVLNESVINKTIPSTFILSESDVSVNKTEVLSMIQTQAALCPYVQLCTLKNRSTSPFIAKVSKEFPCCSECSCNISCIEQGTCCPDFDHEMHQLNKTTDRLNSSKIMEDASEELGCVKTHYGASNRNNSGYKMIVTCPSNFTDLAKIERCERTIDIEKVSTLVDAIPFFDKASDRSYKNIFCYLCNRGADREDVVITQSATFWDIRAYCFREFEQSLYFQVNPLYFAKSLFQSRCNIVFINSGGTDDESKACELDDVIKTCNTQHAATKLETLCKEYTWPISTGRYLKTETYNNYACMLCNDGSLVNYCTQFSSENPKSTIFLEKTDPASIAVAFIGKNKTNGSSGPPNLKTQTIDRFFPDSKGNIFCEKGFIFDDEKNVCRLVFCPMNFFLKDAMCVPMFHKTVGIFHYHLFEVLLPGSLDGDDIDAVEAALVLGIGEFVQQRAGIGNHNLSLYSDEKSHGKISRDRKYFALIVLECNDADGSYVEILKLFNLVVSHQIVVNELKAKSEIRLQFTKTFKFQKDQFVGISGRHLYSVQPKTVSFTKYSEVPESHLCYRIGLYFSEMKNANSRGGLLVKRTHEKLLFPNFQRYNLGKEMTVLVCLEHALGRVAVTNRYVFDSIPPDQTFDKGSRMVVNGGDVRVEDKDRTSSGDITTKNDVDGKTRSIVAVVISAVVVVFVIGVRMLLKRLTDRRV